jgi:hypothetical protein
VVTNISFPDRLVITVDQGGYYNISYQYHKQDKSYYGKNTYLIDVIFFFRFSKERTKNNLKIYLEFNVQPHLIDRCIIIKFNLGKNPYENSLKSA